MTDSFTMGARNVSFILSEANGQRSRANGVVASGQNLVAGQLVADSGGKLIAYTDGATAKGIMLYSVDATAGDTDASYIARDAEVNGNYMTYPAENSAGTVESSANASLALLGIIVR